MFKIILCTFTKTINFKTFFYIAGKILASNVSQNNLTLTKNIDTDIHTETHFNEIFDPEFHLDNIDAHRSRSLPTILLHSEDDEIDNDSIIERSNQTGACKPIKGTKITA